MNDMYEDEIEGAPLTRRRRPRVVKLDFSNPEALQKSAERFYNQNSPENLEGQVMAIKLYYYVSGITEKGKSVFLGPFGGAHEADGELAKLDDGEIFESKSRDITTATREWKAELIKRGEKPDNAIKRLNHKILRKGEKK